MVQNLIGYRGASMHGPAASEHARNDEPLSYIWNPLIAVASIRTFQRPEQRGSWSASDLRSADAEVVLARVYTLASQV